MLITKYAPKTDNWIRPDCDFETLSAPWKYLLSTSLIECNTPHIKNKEVTKIKLTINFFSIKAAFCIIL